MRDFKPLYECICLNTWWTRQSLFGKKVSAHIPLAGKWDQGSSMYWKYGFSVNIFCVYFWWRHTKHNSIIFVWHEFVNEWICQCSLAMSVWGNDGERRDLEMKERHLGKWTNEKNEKWKMCHFLTPNFKDTNTKNKTSICKNTCKSCKGNISFFVHTLKHWYTGHTCIWQTQNT